jgi:predicted Rossmann fold nucleotide-binding protein DprA/Smf involved in DNA uptake
MNLTRIDSTDSEYPERLRQRLGDHAPKSLTILGDVTLLFQPKTALFCSVRCPDEKIDAAYEAARKLRDDGVAVISGFHSPVEKECLRILLLGKQPIIICLARSLAKIRLPADWRGPLEAGRLLLISRFEKSRRADKDTARRRNELVVALSDEVLIIHAEPGGSIERMIDLIDRWNIPRLESKSGA